MPYYNGEEKENRTQPAMPEEDGAMAQDDKVEGSDAATTHARGTQSYEELRLQHPEHVQRTSIDFLGVHAFTVPYALFAYLGATHFPLSHGCYGKVHANASRVVKVFGPNDINHYANEVDALRRTHPKMLLQTMLLAGTVQVCCSCKQSFFPDERPCRCSARAGLTSFPAITHAAYVMPRYDADLNSACARSEAHLALWFFKMLCSLKLYHDKGIAHNDVKPSNVLVRGRHALLMDPGLATPFQCPSGQDLQTLYYRSPRLCAVLQRRKSNPPAAADKDAGQTEEAEAEHEKDTGMMRDLHRHDLFAAVLTMLDTFRGTHNRFAKGVCTNADMIARVDSMPPGGVVVSVPRYEYTNYTSTAAFLERWYKAAYEDTISSCDEILRDPYFHHLYAAAENGEAPLSPPSPLALPPPAQLFVARESEQDSTQTATIAMLDYVLDTLEALKLYMPLLEARKYPSEVASAIVLMRRHPNVARAAALMVALHAVPFATFLLMSSALCKIDSTLSSDALCAGYTYLLQVERDGFTPVTVYVPCYEILDDDELRTLVIDAVENAL